MAASAPLTSGQSQFVSHLSAQTGLNPGVVTAWVLAEESGGAAQARQASNNHDWLNVGYTDSATLGAGNSVWRNPVTAANATAQWLKGSWDDPGFGKASGGIQAITHTAGQSPTAQIAAIQHSGWASSGYPDLPGLYSQYAGGAPSVAPTISGAAQIAQRKSGAQQPSSLTPGGVDWSAVALNAMSHGEKPINPDGNFTAGGGMMARMLSDATSGMYDTPSSSGSATSPTPSTTVKVPTAAAAQSTSKYPVGITNYDNKPLAKWIAPILQWAQAHGWTGTVTSGYRSYAEQKAIYDSGVRPAAVPGTSNHEMDAFPGGAVDVTQAAQLSSVLKRSPYANVLIWAGSKDPVHFSHPHDGHY